ncbi:MAG: ABC transporter permease [Myxococcota bacterium]
MMGRVLALSWTTFQDGLRSQIFANLGVLAAFGVGFALVLDNLTVGVSGRVVMDLGVAVVSLINALVAAFMAVRTMGGEENRHTLMTVLARPVRRSEVVVGKFLGVAGLVTANAAGAMVLLGLAGLLARHVDVTDLARSLVGLSAEAALVTAVTLMFSTFAGSTVAAVLGLGVYVAGLFAFHLRDFAVKGGEGAQGWLGSVFYYAVPNLQRLDFHALNPTLAEALASLLYAACYVVAALALGSAIFERRDLK